jgi:hypothetical protein
VVVLGCRLDCRTATVNGRRVRLLVALSRCGDLLLRAKHLFVAAILAGPPVSHPISHDLFHGGSVCVCGAGRCASGVRGGDRVGDDLRGLLAVTEVTARVGVPVPGPIAGAGLRACTHKIAIVRQSLAAANDVYRLRRMLRRSSAADATTPAGHHPPIEDRAARPAVRFATISPSVGPRLGNYRLFLPQCQTAKHDSAPAALRRAAAATAIRGRCA